MPPEDQTLLRAAARVVMDAADGGLDEQLKRTQHSVQHRSRRGSPSSRRADERAPYSDVARAAARQPRAVQRRRRVRRRRPRVRHRRRSRQPATLPPAPWSNVVANPTFGFAATECGPGYTWSVNSHDNRLTPWSNDPVSDPPGEAMFIRDEETGAVLVGDAAARPGTAAATSCGTARATRLRARAPRAHLDAAAVRAADRPGQGVPSDAAQQLEAARGA